MAANSRSNSQKSPEVPLSYPIIESLVQSEDFSKVNTSVTGCYETLEKMLKNKTGGMSKQKKIRAALKAYDLTIDLLRQLLKTKYDLIRQKQEKTGGKVEAAKK